MVPGTRNQNSAPFSFLTFDIIRRLFTVENSSKLVEALKKKVKTFDFEKALKKCLSILFQRFFDVEIALWGRFSTYNKRRNFNIFSTSKCRHFFSVEKEMPKYSHVFQHFRKTVEIRRQIRRRKASKKRSNHTSKNRHRKILVLNFVCRGEASNAPSEVLVISLKL